MALDKIRNWLATYPGWQEGVTLFVDYLGGLPGCGGVFPQGVEILERREDVLGGVRCRCRLRCMVYQVAGQAEDFAAGARWTEDFCRWVRAQDAAGLAPRLGDGQGRQWIQARNGRLVRVPSAGTGVYGVELVAEYWQKSGE